MGGQNPIKTAKKLLRARKFPKVIELLEPLVIEYRDSFAFHYLLGTACLYVGDNGGAEAYYKRARQLKITDSRIIAAQGSLNLRRGDASRAVAYYLEALEHNKNDKTAKRGLRFIKKHSSPEELSEIVMTPRIRKVYPSLGMNPVIIPAAILVCAFLAAGFWFMKNYRSVLGVNGARADLAYLELTTDERVQPLDTDLESGVYRYILTKNEMIEAEENAKKYFQQGKDNAAQIEINRILNSNAKASIKMKMNQLMEYLETPSFDSLSDNLAYADVAKDPYLYMDCWVIWSGRLANVTEYKNGVEATLLVGYENLTNKEGDVPVVIPDTVYLEYGKPIKLLAQVAVRDGRLLLKAAAAYQPLSGDEL